MQFTRIFSLRTLVFVRTWCARYYETLVLLIYSFKTDVIKRALIGHFSIQLHNSEKERKQRFNFQKLERFCKHHL